MRARRAGWPRSGRGRGGGPWRRTPRPPRPASVDPAAAAGDERAAAALGDHDAVGLERPVGPGDRVDRQPQLGGQRAHRRQAGAGRQLAGGDPAGDLPPQLLERRASSESGSSGCTSMTDPTRGPMAARMRRDMPVDRDVLVVGESLVDIVRGGRRQHAEYPGGSAANVAVALARLGRPVRFATSFADDDHGRLVAEHLEKAGVALAADPAAVARTSTALATIGADGARPLRVRPRLAARPAADAGRDAAAWCTPARSGRCSRPGPTTCSSCVTRLRGDRHGDATTSTPARRSPAPVPTLVGRGRADGGASATW